MFEAQVDLPVQQTALEAAIAAELEADRLRPLLANQPEPVFVMEMPSCASFGLACVDCFEFLNADHAMM